MLSSTSLEQYEPQSFHGNFKNCTIMGDNLLLCDRNSKVMPIAAYSPSLADDVVAMLQTSALPINGLMV